MSARSLLSVVILMQLVIGTGCRPKSNKVKDNVVDSFVVNTHHLDHLYIPVTFSDSTHAGGVSIYAEAPDYHLVDATGEGITCVDDVARAALVYGRDKNISTDSVSPQKLYSLVRFILSMQSANGCFYNFLLPGGKINTNGKTSINTANWWSWRALQTLSELSPLLHKANPSLAKKADSAITLLITKIKAKLVSMPKNSKLVERIEVPVWLPSGSATDQSSILMLGLIHYCTQHPDEEIKNYIRKLADGIIMLQAGDSMHFPYGSFLSWENVWHAYGSDQSYALMKAGEFLQDTLYVNKGIAEVAYFYPWLLDQGMLSSFSLRKVGSAYEPFDQQQFPQIAYGIRPMLFSAIEAYRVTKDEKFARIASRLAAWFTGKNIAGSVMYDFTSGRCYDGILAANKINRNSGAESTIEALLAMQELEKFPAIIIAAMHRK